MKKSKQHHPILHVQNSLGTKFQVKVTILNFWTKNGIKYARRVFLISKRKKKKFTIEFYIFELA